MASILNRFNNLATMPNRRLDANGRSALHIAVIEKDVEAVREILTYKPNVNLLDDQGVSPLREAARVGNLEIVKMLLKSGKANPSLCSKDGVSPLHSAVWKGHLKVAQQLLAYGANPNQQEAQYDDTVLHLATHKMASHSQDDTMIRLLMHYGADPNIKDKNGQSPLYLASHNGNFAAAKALLKSDGIRSIDGLALVKGSAPIHIATSNNHDDVLRLLMQKGVDVNLKAGNGLTPAHLAAEKGLYKTLELLVKEGCADLNKSVDSQGQTPLHRAAYNGNGPTLKCLIDLGCDVNKKDDAGRNAVSVAARYGNIMAVHYLLDMGSDPNLVSFSSDFSALSEAIFYGHSGVAKLLINSKKIDLNHQSKFGFSALHVAVVQEDAEVVAALLKAGAKVDISSSQSPTPLYYAIEKGKKDIVAMLMDSGASLTCFGDAFKGSLDDLLRQTGDKEMKDFIQWHRNRAFANKVKVKPPKR